LRGGPGENFSVLGILEKGAIITEVVSKGDWTQIEAPTNAFAFVTASYLKQEAPVASVVAPVVQPLPATTNAVAEPQPIVATPPVTPAVETNVPVPAPTVAPVMPAPVVETNLPAPPPRVVTHEGFVRSSASLVAPTYYELYDPATSTAINYLYTTTTNLNVSRYDGLHIVVTGEEGMDKRWKDTPVLTIQKIYVLSTNLPVVNRLTSPRGAKPH